MRKKITCFVLLFTMLFQTVMNVSAETTQGDPNWSVTFTSEKKMESNFKTSDLNDIAYGLQPGDNLIVTLKLQNKNSATTDWYMTNKVLQSLEDASSSTSGGAYEYYLTYIDVNGEENVLFSSDTVGGEGDSGGRVGLYGATSALEDYFYLDTLVTGQSGNIRLEVVLDGETQGNTYQNTLADLQMNFAVELNETGGDSEEGGGDDDGGDVITRNRTTRNTNIVQTNDDTNMIPYIISAAVSGILLLFVAFYGRRERKKSEKGAQ